MDIKLLNQNGIPILEVWGDLEFSNWKIIVNRASELIEKDHEKIVISWEHAEYLDSSGMGAIVTIHKLFKQFSDGKAVIFTPHEKHTSILQQANFHTFLEIFTTLEEALESCVKTEVPNLIEF